MDWKWVRSGPEVDLKWTGSGQKVDQNYTISGFEVTHQKYIRSALNVRSYLSTKYTFETTLKKHAFYLVEAYF